MLNSSIFNPILRLIMASLVDANTTRQEFVSDFPVANTTGPDFVSDFPDMNTTTTDVNFVSFKKIGTPSLYPQQAEMGCFTVAFPQTSLLFSLCVQGFQ